jgi:hypothetical protein
MQAVYRNLNAKRCNNGNDIWSVGNAHVAASGHIVKDPGVTHDVNFGLTNIRTNNPQSISKGCLRINARGSREVVAMVGGTIIHETPEGEYLGRLTLDLAAGAFRLITPSGSQTFNPQAVTLWFASNGCHVYRS